MRKPSILICDDEEGLREAFTLILENDYELIMTETGPEAIEAIKTSVPDLILLDIKMPGMNGLVTLQEIRKIAPDVKVIIVTGYQSIETAQESVKHGAIDYITKPFERDEIAKKVAKALS